VLFFDAEYLRSDMRYRHSYNAICTYIQAVFKGVISNDLECLSKTFNDTKHRAVSLRQLRFLLRVHNCCITYEILTTAALLNSGFMLRFTLIKSLKTPNQCSGTRARASDVTYWVS